MKTLHVGGLNPFNRYKTFYDANMRAEDDDTIEIHKDCEVSSLINKNIIIKGNNHTITVVKGKTGFHVQSPVEIHDLIFKVETRANAIVSDQNITLDNVTTSLVGPVRSFYPVVLIKPRVISNKIKTTPKVIINNCKLQLLETSQNTIVEINDTELSSYYKGDIMLSTREDMNTLNGNVTINGGKLKSVILNGNVTVNDSEINKYVDVDGTAIFNNCVINNEHEEIKKNAYKKEPSSGPLKNKLENKYSLAMRNNSNVTINNYQVLNVEDSFIGFYGDNTQCLLENTNNDENKITHRMINSTISFKEFNDENYWDMDNVKTAYVRSKVNSNNNHITAKEKLDNLIGQNAVKEEINSIMNTIEMNTGNNDKNFDFSYNMIFAGDPGTGKTTIAEIVTEALFEVGAIRENKCIKAKSSEIIKGFVGQTGQNMEKIIKSAYGGVLFLDEAYELTVKEGENSFNSDALTPLVDAMENHRSDLVVIAAGYTKEMKEFLASNIGLARRFQWIQFEDYTNDELSKIFEIIRKSYNDTYENEALANLIPPLFKKLTETHLSIPDSNGRVTNGGNGGLVRNVYQQIVQARNNRVVATGTTSALTQNDILIGFKKEINKALQQKL